ncbi:MAG: FAD-dependent oxidoreductase [Lachnospiraceae bacterium]|nr:FAD-dependent oxidoreductase [Lachnospiraceae bacterium]
MSYQYRKEIPETVRTDVLVVGGGPAGICAAVAASRQGVSVMLVERYGAVGGNLTLGSVSPILGKVAPGTMYDEVITLLAEKHAGEEKIETRNGKEIHIDAEEAKGILIRFLRENHVNVMLQCSVADVIKEGNAVTGLVVTSPTGLQVIKAARVIDATGDGLVAFLAGCEYHIGREADGLTQPVTLEFTIDHVDESKAIMCFGGSDPVLLPDGKKYADFCKECEQAGILPKNVSIVRLHKTFYKGERNVNATQMNNISGLETADLYTAEVELRRQIEVIVDFLRKYIPGYEDCMLKTSASTLGVRETRRIVGECMVTDNDVEQGNHYEDAVVQDAWFLIDIHNPAGGGQAEGHSKMAIPYDIRYGALVPLKVDNLLTAGRCISGTHRAHASYRVMAICMATGEAAGIAAALSVKMNVSPRQLKPEIVRSALKAKGVDFIHS